MKKLLFVCATLACIWGCKDAEKKEESTKAPGAVTFPVDTQQIFALSMVSNLPASIAWPYNESMADSNVMYADSIITNISPWMDSVLQYKDPSDGGFNLNNWTRVWGPAVIADSNCDLCTTGISYLWSKHAFVSVSSMTIFKDGSNNYVVGIEATNPSSLTDWKVLDLSVLTTMPYNPAVDTQGQLTYGTFTGLNSYLLQLTDMKTGVKAVDFLNAQSGVSSITVTGHSLGGALSPVLALYLKQNATSTKNIYCLATAGASPGDMQFIKFFDQQMGGSTVRIWNSLDVVPHAWEIDTMKRIDNIYAASSGSISFDAPFACGGDPGPQKPFGGMNTPLDIKGVVLDLTTKLKNNNLVYGSICNGGRTFTGSGTSGSNYFNTVKPAEPGILYDVFKDDEVFLDQLGNQHVAAYSIYFKIVGLHQYMHGFVTTRHKVKNSVAWWSCDQGKNKKDCPVLHLFSESGAPNEPSGKAVALWGAIHKAAWKW